MWISYRFFRKLRDLVVATCEKHYPEAVGAFEPATDVDGLVDQLDNLLTGLVRNESPMLAKIVDIHVVNGRELNIVCMRGDETFTITAYKTMGLNVEQLRRDCGLNYAGSTNRHE